jgi:hypothetical protein
MRGTWMLVAESDDLCMSGGKTMSTRSPIFVPVNAMYHNVKRSLSFR